MIIIALLSKSVPISRPCTNPKISIRYMRACIRRHDVNFFLNNTAINAIYRIISAGLPADSKKSYHDAKLGINTVVVLLIIEKI